VEEVRQVLLDPTTYELESNRDLEQFLTDLDQYTFRLARGGEVHAIEVAGPHLLADPDLLDWTEVNVWEYIERESIPVVDLYFDQGEGKRYRSLGCSPCTSPIDSKSNSVSQIISELSSGGLSHIAERSGGVSSETPERNRL